MPKIQVAISDAELNEMWESEIKSLRQKVGYRDRKIEKLERRVATLEQESNRQIEAYNAIRNLVEEWACDFGYYYDGP